MRKFTLHFIKREVLLICVLQANQSHRRSQGTFRSIFLPNGYGTWPIILENAQQRINLEIKNIDHKREHNSIAYYLNLQQPQY